MKIFNKTLSLAVLFAFLLPQAQVLAAGSAVQGYGFDTIAGYAITLRSSTTTPNNQVAFEVVKPDTTRLSLSTTANAQGVAKAELSDYHTREAGLYAVRANNNAAWSSFNVYPDRVSVTQSQINTDKYLVSVQDNDTATVTVQLKDQYGNALKGHQVQLISSRSEDTITSRNSGSLSNENGQASFTVSSKKSGTAAFTAHDVTANVTLNQRVSIAFMTSEAFLRDVGGDYNDFINVANAADFGPIHHFEISDFPSNPQPNQDVSFKVSAKDDADQVVQNYTGTIHFSVEGSNGSNAVLPNDYAFKAEDLGAHQFSLGLSFKMAGTYKVVVTDLNNNLLKGEATIVVGGNGGSTQQPSGSDTVTLDTPIAGTYGQKIQTISGKAPAGTTVKVMDGTNLLGSVQATIDSKYTFQTTELADGVHKVSVSAVDGSQVVKGSAGPIEFTIDSTAPVVEQLELVPAGNFQAGQTITVKIYSEENLGQSIVVFNGDLAELTPSLTENGLYTATVQAPNKAGTYAIDVILVDQLGNEGSYKNKGQVTINADGTGSTSQQSTQQGTQTQSQQVDSQAPSKVKGVLAYPSNQKVTLVWEAASDNSLVKNYKVYYGFDPSNFAYSVATKDASTTWYVPNLENGKEYYFAITAIDDTGVESAAKSEAVSGVPFASEVSDSLGELNPTNINGQNEAGHNAGDGVVADEMSGTGPEMFLLLGGASFITLVRKAGKGRLTAAAKKLLR